MSGIVLSASVRQNLLSLQSTADLLSTTQNRLSTGKKVNSALDNPTNFFTAQSLDNRAGDINNLLDSIGNGVQVLQAANTGITSLQKLVDSAKSVATQALQATVGYSAKSSVSVTITGATASNILGTGAPADATFTGAAESTNQTPVYSASTAVGTAVTASHQTAYGDATVAGSAATGSVRSAYTSTTSTGSVALQNSAAAAVTSGTSLDTGTTPHLAGATITALTGTSLTINGHTITFDTSTSVTSSAGDTTIGLGAGTSATVNDILTAIGTAGGTGVSAAVDGSGHIQITSGTSTDVAVSGAAASTLGISTTNRGGNALTHPALAGTTVLGGTATAGGSAVLTNSFSAGDTITVNGQSLSFVASGASGANQINVTDTVGTLLSKIDGLSGGSGSAISGGVITLHTGTTADLAISSSNTAALASLGFSAPVSQARVGGISSSVNIQGTTALAGGAVAGGTDGLSGGAALTTADFLIVNGKTITFNSSNTATSGTAGNNNLAVGLGAGTISSVLTQIAAATGGTATVDSTTGKITLTTSTGADVNLGGSNASTLSKLGLSSLAINGAAAATTTTVARTAVATPFISATTTLSGAASSSSNALSTAFAANDTITVNGQTLTFVASGATGNNQINIGDTVGTLLTKIDTLSGNTGAGAVASSVSAGGQVLLHTGTSGDLSISSTNSAALTSLLGQSSVTQARGTGAPALSGLTLNIGATGGGTASTITFGTGANQVASLNDLNTALAANNLQATLAANGTLTISTSNDAASATIGALSGSATGVGGAFHGATVAAPVTDAGATAIRNQLVTQYNNILNQITTTAQDASFNGVNLLSGDTLKLTFNETGSSTLGVNGVNFNASGLGLATLNASDFKDNNSVNAVVSGLNSASSRLRTQASAFGSNLTIVQIRQDFNKNLINVLQTGSSNLTLADTNEEAANSQALSTRQSIAVSALSLANQSQQSVLQLLR